MTIAQFSIDDRVEIVSILSSFTVLSGFAVHNR